MFYSGGCASGESARDFLLDRSECPLHENHVSQKHNKRLLSGMSCLTVLAVLPRCELYKTPLRLFFSINFYIHAMKPFVKNYIFAKNCSMKSALTLLFFLLVIQPGFLVPLFLSSALGDTQAIGKGLLVAPVRLEFEGRIRSGTFKILNRDPATVNYRISFAPLLEKDKGENAKDWVRFSPRRVRLGPGEHQTVRVLARKPLNLAAGKYTARLLIQAIPPARPKSDEPTDNIQINLDIVYGISIPIIIKHNP